MYDIQLSIKKLQMSDFGVLLNYHLFTYEKNIKSQYLIYTHRNKHIYNSVI